MATSSSSLSNLISIASFTGQSKYAADFQMLLTRSVNLQALNLVNLQQQQQMQSDKQTALQTLTAKVKNLQAAVNNLTTAMGLASLTSTVSDSSVASVSLSSGAQTGTYSLEVLDTGAHSYAFSSSSNTSISDPNTQGFGAGTIQLTLGSGPAVTITPAANTLQGLADAINADPSLGVTASLVNIGDSGSPDYRLSLQSSKLSSTSIDLSLDGTPLMDSTVTGRPAVYRLNGIDRDITSDTETVTLAPGVSATLTETNAGSPAKITVTKSTAAIQSALQTFVTIYNATVDQLNLSYGQNANALQGDSILSEAKSALRSITGYSDGQQNGIAYLGLDLDTTGHLTFNQQEFNATAAQGTTPLSLFLGDAGSGFIFAATSALSSLTVDMSSADLNLTQSLTKLDSTISDEVDRINNFQDSLLNRLAQSDALLYQLENQATFYKGLFSYNNQDDN